LTGFRRRADFRDNRAQGIALIGLSASTASPLWPLSRAGAWVMSLSCPAVTMKRSGRPSASASMWIWWLVRLANAPAPDLWPPLSARRLLVGANDGAVDHQIPGAPAGRTSVRPTATPTDIRPRTDDYPQPYVPGPQLYPAAVARSSSIVPRSTHIASPPSSAPCRITELYESAIKPLENPECRSALGSWLQRRRNAGSETSRETFPKRRI
jgi:hypothetical protein